MYISEIGLNHLGSSKKLMNYVHCLNDTNVDALTVQIREPEYYIINPSLELHDSDYVKILKKDTTMFEKRIMKHEHYETFKGVNNNFHVKLNLDKLKKINWNVLF